MNFIKNIERFTSVTIGYGLGWYFKNFIKNIESFEVSVSHDKIWGNADTNFIKNIESAKLSTSSQATLYIIWNFIKNIERDRRYASSRSLESGSEFH